MSNSTILGYCIDHIICFCAKSYIKFKQQVSENSFEEFTLPVEIAAGEEAVFTMSIDPRGITELELPLDRGDIH